MVDMTQVQQFFFKAMIRGWAAGVQKIKIAEMPGYKAIPFQEGEFRLLDCYCVNPHSQMSAGTTTIWFQGVPVWVMNYGGYYEERAILFLKRALLETYEAQRFVGGRGPIMYSEGPLVYVNTPRLNGFVGFEGHEKVFDLAGVQLGYHTYSGMGLV